MEGFDFGEAPETQDDVIEILESLPSGFIKDYDYGLGLLQDFRLIIHEVENIANIKQLVISKKSETSISENEDYITMRPLRNSLLFFLCLILRIRKVLIPPGGFFTMFW